MSATAASGTGGVIDWDALAPGAELAATVVMASGFVLSPDQNVTERYRVERRLGEGGMGQVIAVSLLGSADAHSFALKVVARTVAAASSLDRARATEQARNEATSFAEALRSEAAKQEVVSRHGVTVARLFALVQLGDGSLGLRMELARGRSLEAVIAIERRHKDVAPDSAAALRIVRKLLGQLRRLHELRATETGAGFVHSDIKPGNVFVDDTDQDDVVITLLDFGVATAGKAMVSSLAGVEGGRRTLMIGYTGGTPGYVPPYHFTSQATPLSDVYAALVILYELIALELPWDIAGPANSSSRGSDENDAAQSGAGRLEAMKQSMLRGPAPMRSQRQKLPASEAEIWDAFFAREFRALNELSANVADAFARGDADVERAVSDRVRGLAREYQHKLDEVSAQLFPGGARNVIARPTLVEPVSAEEMAMRPTIRSDPGGSVEPVVSPLEQPWTDTASEERAGAGHSMIVQRDSQIPLAPDGAWSWDAPGAKADAPVRTSGAGRMWLWIVGLLLVAAIPSAIMLALSRRSAPTPTLAGATPGRATADASASSADASANNGVGLGANDASMLGASTGDSATSLAGPTAVVVVAGAGPEVRGSTPSAAGAPAISTAGPVRCVSPVLGAVVGVRAGGRGDVTVCRATTPMPQRSGYFMGTGRLPEGVALTRESAFCRDGSFPLDLTFLQLPAERGTVTSFECERRSGGPMGPSELPVAQPPDRAASQDGGGASPATPTPATPATNATPPAVDPAHTTPPVETAPAPATPPTPPTAPQG